MKTTQKINLLLLTMVTAFSLNTGVAAELEVIFTDGAELAAEVTGKVNFNGAGSINFSGHATDDVTCAAGNVQVASAAPFTTGKALIMNGGDLEATAAMSVPTLTMNAAGTIKSNANVTLEGLSGSGKLSLTDGSSSVAIVTPADLSGASTPMDLQCHAQVGATAASKLSSGAVNVLSGALLEIMAATPACVPGTTQIKSGAVVLVNAGIAVPASGAAGDLFGSGTLSFFSGATLKLRSGVDWGYDINVL